MKQHKIAKKSNFVILGVFIAVFLVIGCLVVFCDSHDGPAGTNSNNIASGSFYIEETGETYQYELVMSGKLPNASDTVSFYVYTDDPNLTFAKVIRMLTSSNYEECDFYISETSAKEK